MRRLIVSNRFKKKLKIFFQKHPELRDVFRDRIVLLQANANHPQLKTHKLTGSLKGALACSLTYEYRIVFSLIDDVIHLLAIGTYDEVY